MVHDIHLISCACAQKNCIYSWIARSKVAFACHLLKQWFHEDAHASITLDYAEWICMAKSELQKNNTVECD